MANPCVSFELLDQIIVVESESTEFIADLQSRFEEVVSHPCGGDDFADLYVSVAVTSATSKAATNAEPRFKVTSRPEGALPLLEAHGPNAGWNVVRALVQWAVDSASGYYVFHSGSVARDGQGILLPGATHSGKSTLTVALAQRGFDILSDEVGAIRADDGMQTGFGRAVSIRSATVAELGIEDRPGRKIEGEGAYTFRADALGLSRASVARPVLLVFPTYRKDGATDLHPLRPAAAVMALYEASCSQPRWKVRGLDFLIELATTLSCFELSYSNMHDAALQIEKAFTSVCASGSPAATSLKLLASEQESSPSQTHSIRPLSRADLVTRELDGEFLLYDTVTGKIALINRSAAVIIELCDGTRTEGEIVVEVRRLFHSKSEKLDEEVRATLAEFRANHLLVPTRSKLTD